jgi:peptidoglycan/xylan/chitin deacetylase (PgdA/CDA1 family)
MQGASIDTRYIRNRAAAIVGKARRRFVPGGVILAYHRVADLDHDAYATAVSPRHFVEHLEVLRKTCTVVKLSELREAVQRRRPLPHRAVAITFDDGCVDFLDHGYPAIRKLGFPATVFVASDHLEQKRRFWSDELEFLFHDMKAWPGPLTLSTGPLSCRWEDGTGDRRMDVFWQVYKLIKPLSDNERIAALRELTLWAGPRSTYCPGYRAITADEAIRVVREGFVEIGAHTVTHPPLSALSEDEQVFEISGGRQRLIELLGAPVNAFAYPYGEQEDFDNRTVGLVKQAGFDLACTMIRGSVEAGADPFTLRRCMVLDWPARAFARHLESFFAA